MSKQRLIDANALKEWFLYCVVRMESHEIAKQIDKAPTVKPFEWVSVDDRLPELHTKVLCCGKKGGRFIAELSTWGEGHLYWTKKDGKGCSKVTHWMPLPDAPKGSDSNE